MTNASDLPFIINTAKVIENYLVCPRSRDPLAVRGDVITCSVCGFRGRVQDGVAVVESGKNASFFDDKFEVMAQGHWKKGGDWELCYERQVKLVETLLSPGQVVLDLGCGPLLPYSRPLGAFAIGLDPSFPSIRANRQVDLAVCGTATNLPLPNHSVDIAVAFYSVHHMVGGTIRENEAIIEKAFFELGRVIKPGGSLLVFEMTPWRPFAALQGLLWNQAKRLLGPKLDMYFRSAQSMIAFGHLAFPDAIVETIDYRFPAFKTLPPVFSLPWLRLPKLIYPLKARSYRWQLPNAGASITGPNPDNAPS